MSIKAVLLSAGIMSCMYSFSDARVASVYTVDEKTAIKTFFSDFKDAVNSKNIEIVKKMSGESWPHWSKVIDRGRLESIEIMEFGADMLTNVVTKCIAVDSNNRYYPAVVVFTIRKADGVYSISKVRFPEHERRHQEFVNAQKTVKHLVLAMNNHDLSAVKGLVTFGDAADFEDELTSRGLLWIKDALDSGISVPLAGSGVSREENDAIIGRIYVPITPAGTNILRKVVFKDGKIDCFASREERADEIHKRVCKESPEEKCQYDKRVEEYRRELLQSLRENK